MAIFSPCVFLIFISWYCGLHSMFYGLSHSVLVAFLGDGPCHWPHFTNVGTEPEKGMGNCKV